MLLFQVDLDDMSYEEGSGSQGGTFSSPCRCSGHFEITEGQLEAGYHFIYLVVAASSPNYIPPADLTL